MADWVWAVLAVVCTILLGLALGDVAKAINNVATAIRDRGFGPEGYNARGRGP